MSRGWMGLVLLASTAAAAQQPPAPPPEVKKTVDAFFGNWASSITMTTPDGKETKFKGTWACGKKIAGGIAVECSMSTKIPGMGEMIESDFIGYDPETKSVHMMTWSNAGEIHDHKGTWTDDKTVTIDFTGTAGGKPLQEHMVITWADAKSLKYVFTAKSADGEFKVVGDCKRK